MKINIRKKISFDELVERIKEVEILNHPEIKVYRNSRITIQEYHPSENDVLPAARLSGYLESSVDNRFTRFQVLFELV